MTTNTTHLKRLATTGLEALGILLILTNPLTWLVVKTVLWVVGATTLLALAVLTLAAWAVTMSALGLAIGLYLRRCWVGDRARMVRPTAPPPLRVVVVGVETIAPLALPAPREVEVVEHVEPVVLPHCRDGYDWPTNEFLEAAPATVAPPAVETAVEAAVEPPVDAVEAERERRLQVAVKRVLGGMSAAKAARKGGVPASTLRRRVAAQRAMSPTPVVTNKKGRN